MDLAGKAAIVTGASRGLGRALARQLAEAGARVVLVARSAVELEQAVSEIRAAGGEAHGLSFDVGRKEDVYPLAGAAAALVGPIDLLVHNASSLGPTPLRLLLDTECEDLCEVLETNLVGPFRLSKAIAGSNLVKVDVTTTLDHAEPYAHLYVFLMTADGGYCGQNTPDAPELFDLPAGFTERRTVTGFRVHRLPCEVTGVRAVLHRRRASTGLLGPPNPDQVIVETTAPAQLLIRQD